MTGKFFKLWRDRSAGWEMIYEQPTLQEPIKRKLWLNCTGSGMNTKKLLGALYQDEEHLKAAYSKLIFDLKTILNVF